ncbi:V-type ATP synthase subunit D [candidate division KSB3 bacterium]|uniref:V-type ATP synthase subunit D n=1 Tax=candidate division KSB3 bacterium TaxID=2044937 RepID=A0A9D5Q6U8_9BACT|nr:V-type ATP synthase subunit D [candidate division KSB3 bacterium]MBD3325276.1 V-type ATP synthase subunit D [candidate division KSB3 bacterium]
MARLNIPSTKSNLLRLSDELKFAVEGRDLLDEKREILIMEIMGMLEEAHRKRLAMEKELAEAYQAFAGAKVILGAENVRRAALGIQSEAMVDIYDRSVMGVVVPTVQVKWNKTNKPRYGFLGTTYELDRATHLFASTLEALVELAEIETTLWRLATELKKVQRRFNALENILIPQYDETVRYIEYTLEEKEREIFFQLKRVKEKLKQE